MQKVFFTALPFFAIVFIGFLAGLRYHISKTIIPDFNKYILYYALPFMLFGFSSQWDLQDIFSWPIFITYLTSSLMLLGCTYSLGLLSNIPLKQTSFLSLVSCFPNTGFIGLVLISSLLGPKALGPVMLSILIDTFITSSICLYLALRDDGSIFDVFKGLYKNPMIWGFALGLAVSYFNLALPQPITLVVGLLGGAATPCALFVIGLILAPSKPIKTLKWRIQGIDVILALFCKLFLHPCLILAIGLSLIHFGVDLPSENLIPLILAAALPSAANVVMLAQQFNADSEQVSRIVMYSTLVALLSFTAWGGLILSN
ncbi:MAG: AEC family transporter [Gammaproteobacteria bacterium]|nr:AEC family transporter [Gammaproteobacteria bacterium]